MLKLRNIKKKFGNTEVLKGVNLEMKKGNSCCGRTFWRRKNYIT